jgi:predicted MFS family arabinose efflux permease
MGGAIASPTALSLITVEFKEGKERNQAIAVYAAVSGAGAALGLLLGGVLTAYASWRWVLFVNVPIGIGLIVGAFLLLHESERLRGRLDLVGALLSVLAMVSTVYGFIHVAHDGWGNTQTFVVFSAAVVFLAAFIFFEAKVAPEPMMPLQIFENRNRAGSYLIMLVAGAAMFGLFYFITFFVQLVRDYGPLKTGVAFLPVAIVIGITSQIVSKMIPKTGPKIHMVIGTILLTLSLLWLSTVDANSGYLDKVLPGILILALGMGNLFVPLTLTAVAGVQNSQAGLASALLNVGQQLGGALGLSVMTTVFATAARNYAGENGDTIQRAIGALPQDLQGKIGQEIASAAGSGLQPAEITQFVASLPPGERGPAAAFFAGPYQNYVHDLLAHASGQGFLMGAVFGVVSFFVALLMINVKKSDLPSHDAVEAVAAAA